LEDESRTKEKMKSHSDGIFEVHPEAVKNIDEYIAGLGRG